MCLLLVFNFEFLCMCRLWKSLILIQKVLYPAIPFCPEVVLSCSKPEEDVL